MLQGMCMFDEHKRLVICNQSYADLYALPVELTARGTHLIEILEYRVGKGSHAATRDSYLENRLKSVDASGRYIETIQQNDGRAIEIQFYPLAGGAWIALHEDVTDGLAARAASAREEKENSHQAERRDLVSM